MRCLIVPFVMAIVSANWFAVPSVGRAAEVDTSKLPPPSTRKPDFETLIWPIIDRHCVHCHGEKTQKGKYRMDSREAALKGSDGAVITPGSSEKSPLIHMVAGLIADMEMPPLDDKGKVKPLTPEEIGLLRAWIDQGAPWPEKRQEPVVTVDYAKEIEPILKTACYECHGSAQQKGDFRADTKEALLQGGKSYGRVVLPSNGAKSPLIVIVSGKDEDIAMPEKHKLNAEQVELVKKWIDQGAK